MLGARAEWLESFASLELQWRAGRLWVASWHRDKHGLLDAVIAHLLYAWSFRVWSDSRWLGFGHGARVLLFSMFLGLENLLAFALETG